MPVVVGVEVGVGDADCGAFCDDTDGDGLTVIDGVGVVDRVGVTDGVWDGAAGVAVDVLEATGVVVGVGVWVGVGVEV